jgi:hypothetical protein
MNVEIGTEAAQFPEKKHKWDFRCSAHQEALQFLLFSHTPHFLLSFTLVLFFYCSTKRNETLHVRYPSVDRIVLNPSCTILSAFKICQTLFYGYGMQRNVTLYFCRFRRLTLL